MNLILNRYYTQNGNNATVGYITSEDREALNFSPICFTIERPLYFNGKSNVRDDIKTKQNESCCINEGTYDCAETFSPKFKTNLFLLQNTEGRTGIRIHTGNTIADLQGCIAPCKAIRANSGSTVLTVSYIGTDSRTALNELYQSVGNVKNFTLTIKNGESKSLDIIKKYNLNFYDRKFN